jgi:hypothetical protein
MRISRVWYKLNFAKVENEYVETPTHALPQKGTTVPSTALL